MNQAYPKLCLIEGIGCLAWVEMGHTQGRSGGHNIFLDGAKSKLQDATQNLKPVFFNVPTSKIIKDSKVPRIDMDFSFHELTWSFLRRWSQEVGLE